MRLILLNILFAVILCAVAPWPSKQEVSAKTTRALMPHEHLELPRPELVWVKVQLEDGTMMWALDKSDYIGWLQYKIGLEHEYTRCQEGALYN